MPTDAYTDPIADVSSAGSGSSPALATVRDLLLNASGGDPAASAGETSGEGGTSSPNVASLPDPVFRPNGEAYYPRRIGGADGHLDVEMLADARSRSIFPLLAGYPGGGKTALVEAAFGDEVHTVNCDADTEVADLLGGYVPTDTPGKYDWVDGPAIKAAKAGEVLFLDDVTVAPPGVLAKVYPLMDGRGKITVTQHEGEEVVAADGFFIVGAHNPGVTGTVLSEALASRFLLHLTVGTDLALASQMGINRDAIRIAQRLATQRDQGALSWAPEMRELLAFHLIDEAYGTAIAASNLVSVAPPEDRDIVLEEVQHRFPDARLLALDYARA